MEKELEKIWKKLNNFEERIKLIEDLFKKTPDLKEVGNEYDQLLAETGINIDVLKEIVYFDDSGFTIITEVTGKDNKEKQINATLLILTINDICYGNNSVKSQDLKAKLEYLGIRSLVNLSTNLKTIKNYIIPDGKSGSLDYSYKITLPGKKEGLRILNTFSKKITT